MHIFSSRSRDSFPFSWWATHTRSFCQEETRITQVADPWGGSYMMESLTEDMIQGAKEIIDEVGSAVGSFSIR